MKRKHKRPPKSATTVQRWRAHLKFHSERNPKQGCEWCLGSFPPTSDRVPRNLLAGVDLSDVYIPADATELAQRSILASRIGPHA